MQIEGYERKACGELEFITVGVASDEQIKVTFYPLEKTNACRVVTLDDREAMALVNDLRAAVDKIRRRSKVAGAP